MRTPRWPVPRALLLAASGAALAAAVPAALGAGTPPDTRSFDVDGPIDVQGTAPDIIDMSMLRRAADDGLVVTTRLDAADLAPGEALGWALDTDANTRTGNRAMGGAEVMVTMTGADGPDVLGFARWARTQWVPEPPPAGLAALPPTADTIAWQAPVGALGLQRGGIMHLRLQSTGPGGAQDLSPDANEPPLALLIALPPEQAAQLTARQRACRLMPQRRRLLTRQIARARARARAADSPGVRRAAQARATRLVGARTRLQVSFRRGCPPKLPPREA